MNAKRIETLINETNLYWNIRRRLERSKRKTGVVNISTARHLVKGIKGHLRSAVARRTAGQCFYCGEQLDNETMTIDHFIPRSKWGNGDLGNLVPACKPCNCSKGSQLPTNAQFDRFYALPPTFNDPLHLRTRNRQWRQSADENSISILPQGDRVKE